ncbi:MAG TPA: hypothetical protein VFB61_05070 [Gemmatimonadales bacterium]|nr:hypothetical protein [Gemmatimonadales bacterium]
MALGTGQREERDTRSARQYLPVHPGRRSASVAGTAACEGYVAPPAQNQPRRPVLEFPEPGLDDTAAYQGYKTRFYRDSKNNTVQIYHQPRGGRTVLVWADAANESAGFTARDAAGRPAPLEWGAETAQVSDSGAARTLEYQLSAPISRVDLGWFVLGSMRIERDFVYAKRHLRPFAASPFRVAEETLLVAAVAKLPPAEQASHLRLLRAGTLEELRSRLDPRVSSSGSDTLQIMRVERPSLDGRNRLVLELWTDPRRVKAQMVGRAVSLRTRPGSEIHFSVRVTTDAAPLTPLAREQIFTPEFLGFLANANRDSAGSGYARRMERQVRGVELLSSEEKLMAGLPNFATYFGRDMMVTALMMRPIWLPAMSEHVIASVLRKLGRKGDVSHEEALGGQAIREQAVVYDSLITSYASALEQKHQADQILEQARQILRDLQSTRENYFMVDDEFQLPVLAARYLADTALAPDAKRRFLLEKGDGTSRLVLLLRELALVSGLTRAYVLQSEAGNLVSFPKRDSIHWRSASWRDSDAGYAGGRFAMDINAIWAPAALKSTASILRSLSELGFPARSLDTLAPVLRESPLLEYARDSSSLTRAIAAWSGARRHFAVTYPVKYIRSQVEAKLSSLPQTEQQFWRRGLRNQKEPRDSLTFLALALDSAGTPIPVVNTDPATDLFLNPALRPSDLREDLLSFLRPYPVGLFVAGLGPLVANDAYASPRIWKRFEEDRYHGPRVVWGREVNLLLQGLANQIRSSPSQTAGNKASGLREALGQIRAAVDASGLQHNELWSYEIQGRRLVPVRYGTSSDVQLWNTTDLAVEFVLSQLIGR